MKLFLIMSICLVFIACDSKDDPEQLTNAGATITTEEVKCDDETVKKDNKKLFLAIQSSDIKKVIDVTSSSCAKSDAKNQGQAEPLIFASYYGNIEIVNVLISWKSNVNAQDGHGWTSLIFAARYGHVEVAKALLDAGADWTIKSNKGKTAKDVARDDRIVKLIEAKEAAVKP